MLAVLSTCTCGGNLEWRGPALACDSCGKPADAQERAPIHKGETANAGALRAAQERWNDLQDRMTKLAEVNTRATQRLADIDREARNLRAQLHQSDQEIAILESRRGALEAELIRCKEDVASESARSAAQVSKQRAEKMPKTNTENQHAGNLRRLRDGVFQAIISRPPRR